jgi:hypothetical protein
MSSAKTDVKLRRSAAALKASYRRLQKLEEKTVRRDVPAHDCEENAVPYTNSGGALGHGFECGICGKFLQAG